MKDSSDSIPEIIAVHKVPPGTSPQRLSEYARDLFAALPSRKSVKKAIKSGRLLVNGKPSSTGHWAKEGEELSVIGDSEDRTEYELKLNVLYEDDFLAVVNKPADLAVSGPQARTLANALRGNLRPSPAVDAIKYPRPVHRLDRMTGGPVLIAKTLSAAAKLGGLFETQSVEKTYLAVVHGHVECPLRLDSPIDGKEAMSLAHPLSKGKSAKWGPWTLVEVKPVTGRQHQIRIHLSGAGHPIAGDAKYGGRPVGRGLMLCAYRLRFAHPETGVFCDVSSGAPKKFRFFLRNENGRSV